MGTAHVTLYTYKVKELEGGPYSNLFTILRQSEFDDKLTILLVESDALPEGYHGEQDMILECTDGKHWLRFKRECDV